MKGAKKTVEKTTEEVTEENGAEIIDGGSQDAGGSQTQERVVVEALREVSEERSDSETIRLRRSITGRVKRKRIESMESMESSDMEEDTKKRDKAKKRWAERDGDLRAQINSARKRTERRGTESRERAGSEER